MISLEEIEKAYSTCSREIFTYILRSVHDHDTAEDILQEVFIKLLHYSEKKEVHGANIRALLYTIARTVTIDSVRAAAKRKTETTEMMTIADTRHSPEKDSSEEIIDFVNNIIESMCEPEKSIILLRQNGLTYTEISSVTKIPERTLKRKTRNIIENIRKKLQAEGFLVPDDTNSSGESFND